MTDISDNVYILYESKKYYFLTIYFRLLLRKYFILTNRKHGHQVQPNTSKENVKCFWKETFSKNEMLTLHEYKLWKTLSMLKEVRDWFSFYEIFLKPWENKESKLTRYWCLVLGIFCIFWGNLKYIYFATQTNWPM